MLWSLHETGSNKALLLLLSRRYFEIYQYQMYFACRELGEVSPKDRAWRGSSLAKEESTKGILQSRI